MKPLVCAVAQGSLVDRGSGQIGRFQARHDLFVQRLPLLAVVLSDVDPEHLRGTTHVQLEHGAPPK